MEAVLSKTALQGGEFLIKDSRAEDIFIPEELNEEQMMIREMVRDFLHNEILPNSEKIEHQEDNISPRLLEKMAALGLLGTHMPEVYGGMQLDTNTNTLIGDALGPAGAFTVSYAAHIGIGMLPILYFGTEEQKDKYLPRLINGELKAAYCLTEPGSGSDALAAKTRADLSADGKNYLFNGQKMWISNAGFADLFIVFAKIDGDKFTGFIVERDSAGLTLGAEEKKLGIKGSSTRQVFFENTPVPVENVLGKIGKGHLIAFNALNTGRFKLCALSLGGAKYSVTTAIRYANERIQFGVPISSFGAIQYKLAEQAIRIFSTESALFRVSNLMELKKQEFEANGASFGEAELKAAEEYAIECSILKVTGSEALDYVVDETLQVHGGMGFSEEGTAARAYRDARINRIYEGTNEINRLLSIDMLLKRAMKGALDIVGPAWQVQKELASMPSFEKEEGLYAEEKKAVKDFKKAVLMVAGAAAKLQMEGKLDLKNEQEIIMNVADMLSDLFLAESTLLRVEKLAGMQGKVKQEVYDAILKVFIHDATLRMNKNGTDALASFAEGDLLRTMLMGLKRFTKYPAQNVKTLRRELADVLIAANEYAL
ncbi:acyl-CoA dehydrogenase family protein [Haliscomenobacter hydrossis]|uniref:Butyryl-CoA dehydrogenase n=1 Tax=Haliscomenobacter hydrossis (strain ATCC 27775 / DSM 1100 / LMG 10767 / O) TaxID=760192 RepID=F4L1G4_HALH1|nr:acyl-CoA dehydrogenase family protein [Haliscomenobacter hydrossis]AEE53861.1 Butyryl-CoA dehydrogenase [Haliscomenobacter hydrossis DSM 1100]